MKLILSFTHTHKHNKINVDNSHDTCRQTWYRKKKIVKFSNKNKQIIHNLVSFEWFIGVLWWNWFNGKMRLFFEVRFSFSIAWNGRCVKTKFIRKISSKTMERKNFLASGCNCLKKRFIQYWSLSIRRFVRNHTFIYVYIDIYIWSTEKTCCLCDVAFSIICRYGISF